MEDKHIECSKCGGDMEIGQVMSPMRNMFGMLLSPNLAEWFAGKTGQGTSKEKHPLTVYRCKKCGYLECYAN